MIGAGAAALGLGACLAILVGDARFAFPPGALVAASHLAVACPTEDVEKAIAQQGFPDSAAALARMTQAKCKAIAPQTRFLVVILMESGVMLVQPASDFSEPLMVLSRDFSLVRPPT